MKKTVLFALCAALTIILVGCGEEKEPEVESVTTTLSTTEETELYSGDNLWGNLFDEQGILLTNAENNPGDVVFKVWMGLDGGEEELYNEEPKEIAPGQSKQTPLIASSYQEIRITAQAVDTEGEYVLSYDHPAK